MPTNFRSRWSTIALLAVALTAGLLLSGREAVSYQNDAKPTKWEYTAVNINSNELAVKLTELGNSGWEVFSVVPAQSKVDGSDGTARVISEKYDVSARKRTAQ